MLRAFLVMFLTVTGIAATSDRGVAEWVLRAGGSVVVEGGDRGNLGSDATPRRRSPGPRNQSDSDHLKAEKISSISAISITCASCMFPDAPGTPCLPRPQSSRSAISALLTGLETFALSLPVQTEIPMEDDAVAKLAPLVQLRELRLAQTKIKGRTLAPFTHATPARTRPHPPG